MSFLYDQISSLLAFVEDGLYGSGFAYPSVACSTTPVEQKEILNNQITKLEEEIKTCEEEIVSYDDQRAKIKFFADYQTIREEKYAVATSLPQSEHTFVISGYIPEIYIKDVEESLADYAVSIETKDLKKKEKAPVVLKNNAFQLLYRASWNLMRFRKKVRSILPLSSHCSISFSSDSCFPMRQSVF